MAEEQTIITTLRGWSEQESFTPEMKEQIEAWYLAYIGKEFQRTSCSNCYRDACILLYLHIKNGNGMATQRLYHLKAGALLRESFGDSTMYTESNLTDDFARSYLRKYPDEIVFFSSYPDNWEEDIKTTTTATKRSRKRK